MSHRHGVARAIDDALASLAASDAAMEIASAELRAQDATIDRFERAYLDARALNISQSAMIERVRALVADPPEHDGRISTHWGDCYKVHRGCLAFAIRATLEEPSS
jgi:hypothetical protein